MKKIFLFLLIGVSALVNAQTSTTSKAKNFFELKVYEFKTAEQQAVIDQFLSAAYLPYLHRKGIKHVGVFTGIANDTAAVKKLYVLIPYTNLAQISVINKAMFKDKEVAEKGAAYLDATSESPAYSRIVNYILEGFRLAPGLIDRKSVV